MAPGSSHSRRHPVDQLTRSHERLREQLAALTSLGKAAQVERDELDELVAWFHRQGARHEADEKGSLFPRLRGAATDPATRGMLDRLADEHRVHAKLHAELAGVHSVADLACIADQMGHAYRAHLELE
jgi:iron-sulfur cluster repair protein YtfE (RIC family)